MDNTPLQHLNPHTHVSPTSWSRANTFLASTVHAHVFFPSAVGSASSFILVELMEPSPFLAGACGSSPAPLFPLAILPRGARVSFPHSEIPMCTSAPTSARGCLAVAAAGLPCDLPLLLEEEEEQEEEDEEEEEVCLPPLRVLGGGAAACAL